MTPLLSAGLLWGLSALCTGFEPQPARVGARSTEPSISSGGAFSAVEVEQEGPKQDAPPPIPPITTPKDDAPIGDSPGDALTPGLLPADTDPKAQEAWQRTTRGRVSGQTPGALQRVSAFDLAIEVRIRSADNQTNDSPKAWRYQFLSPRYVRVTTENQRQLLRGPGGDFLIDPERHEVIRLTESRENKEDLRQLDESVGIAQNFIALTDPSALRISRLSLLPAAPPGLPPALQKRAGDLALQWLELRTPDFRLVAAPGPSPTPAPNLVRVLLGTDPRTGVVDLALVDVDSNAAALTAAAVLIELARYAPIDGYQMPQQIKVYEVDEKRSPRAFRVEPTTSLGVLTKSASLRATFKPEDFAPPK